MNANERELILKDDVYQIWCASTRMEALCQYKEDSIMEANECKSKKFISVYSRAFAVDYRRGDYKGLGARMF
jgi:hypothetical protein